VILVEPSTVIPFELDVRSLIALNLKDCIA